MRPRSCSWCVRTEDSSRMRSRCRSITACRTTASSWTAFSTRRSSWRAWAPIRTGSPSGGGGDMRHLIPLFLCLVLASCASLQETRQQNRNTLTDDRIALDATNQLARLYPPAKTQFNLIVTEPREFAELLAAKLRSRGYAISETVKAKRVFFADTFAGFQQKPGGQSDEGQPQGMEATAAPPTSLAAGQGMELSYILDTPEHGS